MSALTCLHCARPLTRRQRAYCSRICKGLGYRRRFKPRTCPQCATPLTQRQLRNETVCCSRTCRDAGTPQPMRMAVLNLLRGTGRYWMTTSDLALLAYGFDDLPEMGAIRQLIAALRRDGYVIESRQATWAPTGAAPMKAHRLISEPSAQRQEAA